MISIIVAIAENYAIGKDNQLLWHISNDLQHFKKVTSGHTVLMGKNTYFSLPKKPLPNRKNIVITDNPNEVFDGCFMAYSIEDALAKINNNEETFIMGGGSVYRQFFPYADKLYITKIKASFEADTFFPEISDTDWELIENEDGLIDSNSHLSYSFLTYKRKDK